MTDTDPIDRTSDVLDSRDIIARIDYLSGEDELTDEESAELSALESLASEGESLADWQYGEALISDDYFEDYARELAEDTGMIPTDAPWPVYCIDWEYAARELRMDYTPVEYDGMTFWGRS